MNDFKYSLLKLCKTCSIGDIVWLAKNCMNCLWLRSPVVYHDYFFFVFPAFQVFRGKDCFIILCRNSTKFTNLSVVSTFSFQFKLSYYKNDGFFRCLYFHTKLLSFYLYILSLFILLSTALWFEIQVSSIPLSMSVLIILIIMLPKRLHLSNRK